MSLARLPFTDFWCLFGACLVLAFGDRFPRGRAPAGPNPGFPAAPPIAQRLHSVAVPSSH
jgi:hypothetical protein